MAGAHPSRCSALLRYPGKPICDVALDAQADIVAGVAQGYPANQLIGHLLCPCRRGMDVVAKILSEIQREIAVADVTDVGRVRLCAYGNCLGCSVAPKDTVAVRVGAVRPQIWSPIKP